MNWKIWLLIVCILASLLAIFPLDFQKGVKIVSVEIDSPAYEYGLRQGQVITSIDGTIINNKEDYNLAVSKFPTQNDTKLSIGTKEGLIILFTNQTPNIVIKKIEKTRIKTGLDLSGGARALIKAQEKDLTKSELGDLIDITNQRLNVYGLRDVQIKPVTDLTGNNFMLVEIAGSTPNELENLVTPHENIPD